MSSRPELSTGEALVGLLEAYGVDTIFGIPGVHNVEMYRALPRSRIKHVLVRHEQGAGFMADGYARATGKPGVCFTITGPGLLNILTPMGQAWSDSSNVLVISSALDIGDARKAAAVSMKCWTSAPRPPPSPALPCAPIRPATCAIALPGPLPTLLPPGPALPISKFRSMFCECPQAMAGRPVRFSQSHRPQNPRLQKRPKSSTLQRLPSSSWAAAPWMRAQQRYRSPKNWAAPL